MAFLLLIANLISAIFGLIKFVVIVSAILNLLIHFEVLNRFRQRWVYKLEDLLNRVTEPMYAYIRRYIPPFNGIDLSPLVVLLGLTFIEKAMYILIVSLAG